MKFYLTIFVIFGIVIAGAVNLPHLTKWIRKRDIETTAKDEILAGLKDPSSIRWNAKSISTTPQTTLLTYDFTGIKDAGGPVREIWTFEFDTKTKDLLGVKKVPAGQLDVGGLAPPR